MLLYNNKKNNRNEHRIPISAMLNSNYLKMSSGYNLSHAHFLRTLAVFVCILEILNEVFTINFSGHLILGAQFFDFTIYSLFTFL